MSNGGIGGVFVVFASTSPGERHKGISAFIVEKDTPGLVIGYREKTLGLRGLDIRTVYFEDCFVPRSNRLNGENKRWERSSCAPSTGRLTLAAAGRRGGSIAGAGSHLRRRAQAVRRAESRTSKRCKITPRTPPPTSKPARAGAARGMAG